MLVDRLMVYLSHRVLGNPSTDRLKTPLFLADLEVDEIPELLINAAPLPLPRLGVLLGRHETIVLGSHSGAAEFAAHRRWVLPNGSGDFFLGRARCASWLQECSVALGSDGCSGSYGFRFGLAIEPEASHRPWPIANLPRLR
jgi:hypothetical protein